MRALEFIAGHVIYNPAYTYKFQQKTTLKWLENCVEIFYKWSDYLLPSHKFAKSTYPFHLIYFLGNGSCPRPQ